MNLLPMRDTEKHSEGGIASTVFGVSSLSIGLGAMIVLASYLADEPIGSAEFFTVEHVTFVAQDASGHRLSFPPVDRIVPSMTMVWCAFFRCMQWRARNSSKSHWIDTA